MSINLCKLRAPDFVLGKIIVLAKTVIDGLRLLIENPSRESFRFCQLMLKVKPLYTMVTNKNLISLYRLVQEVNKLYLPGDIVECGVWNGGSAAIMALASATDQEAHQQRKLWLFDSFQGVPKPSDKDGQSERVDYFEGWNKGDTIKVKQIFQKLGLPWNHVNVIEGWFNDTLENSRVEQIAILHIDADWYESVKHVLDTFYNRVVPGGFIILNDFNTWQGCNDAVNDFFMERRLNNIILKEVEPKTGAYFQKPLE